MTQQEKEVVRALREAAKRSLVEWQVYALSRFKNRRQFAEHEPAEHMQMCRVEAAIETSEIVIPDEEASGFRETIGYQEVKA